MQNNFNMDLNKLSDSLADVLSGSNERIKNATSVLKKFTKTIECIEPLLYLITNCPNEQYRQLASILLKRNGVKLYSDLSEDKQNIFKTMLIDRYFIESCKPVRTSLATLIGNTIADSDNVLKIIESRIQGSSSVEEKEKAIILLGTLIEFAGPKLKDHYRNLFNFFQINITDSQNQNIRRETLKCFMHALEQSEFMHETTVTQYKQLIPPVIHVLEECVKNHLEDLVLLCFDVFNYIAESKTSILDENFHVIINYIFSESILFNKSLSLNVKEIALDFILVVSEHHKKVLTRTPNLLPKVIGDLISICSLPYPQKSSLEEESDSLQDVTLALLESLSQNLPPKTVYQIFLGEIGKLIHSNDENKMNAGFLIFAAICEGCRERIRKDLESIVKQLIPLGLNNPSPRVKGASITAIGYLSEFLVPEIIDYHKDIIPYLLNAFTDADKKVVEKAIFAINIFCENMEHEIEPYLATIMPAMAVILTSEHATGKIAFMTIGSCVSSAEKKFYPYLSDCLQVITTVIFKKNTPELIPIQAAAIQSLGKIIFVFYPEEIELYKTYILPAIEYIYNSMHSVDDSEIREAGLCFFYFLASALQSEFDFLLEKVTEFALKTASSEQGISYEKEKKEFSLDTDSEDEFNQNATGAKVHMNFLDEKAAAIHALGEFAQACPLRFAPFMERTMDILEQTYDYFYENIRNQTAICLKDLAEASIKAINNGVLPKFERGLPLKIVMNSSYELVKKTVLENVTEKLLHYIEKDESAEVATTAIEALGSLCRSIGPIIIENCYNDVLKIIKKKLKNREKDIKNGEDEDEDSIMVFEYITELIPGIAKAMGKEFISHFEELMALLWNSTHKNRDSDEHIQIIGCFAESFKYIPEALGNYTEKFIKLFEDMINEKDDEVNRNIAFCLGIFCKKRPDILIDYYPRIAVILNKILTTAEFLEARENVMAAFCRMIMFDPSKVSQEKINSMVNIINTIHQELVKHVFPFLPFKGDVEEEKTVLKFIIFLCEKDENTIVQNIEKCSEILLDGLLNSKKYHIKEKIINKIGFIMKNICSKNTVIAGKVEAFVMGLKDNDKNRLVNILK